jgi:hypothetical protein
MALDDLVKFKQQCAGQLPTHGHATDAKDTWAVINLSAGAMRSDGLHDAAIVQTARGVSAASAISNRLNDLWKAEHPGIIGSPPPYCCCVLGSLELSGFELTNKAVIRHDTIPEFASVPMDA